jgi:hypothetical protein
MPINYIINTYNKMMLNKMKNDNIELYCGNLYNFY